MLTPAEIEALSDPIVEVYRACVDELLINIARHLKAGSTGSLEWQAQKLGEFGQLRRENIEIIKQYTGNIPELLNGALGEALTKTLSRIDPELSKAAALGLFAGIDLKPEAAQEINNILTYYSAQAVEQFNLVNTVMLDHSLEQYRHVLADTSIYELKLAKAQAILNEQTGAVATGISSRQEALRKAVSQMNAAGLRGFKDAAGHYWSAEAYVNMDVRTTVHNVATQAVFTRNEQYGNNLVAVSSHAGARELCFPYQGQVYSTDGSSGTVEDLHGETLEYDSLDNTSYGLPAGLLGINCGHFISPFIPGLSAIRDTPQDKEENDRQYALSQQQRRLEREVRYAKREVSMMDAMGDKAGFEKAAAKLQQKQDNLRRFTTNTGRTARVDRTQVQGYNRSIAGKVAAANRKAESQLSTLDKIKRRNIDEGGTYRVLPYAKAFPDKIRVRDPGVEQYKKFIAPEYHAQSYSAADRAQLWDGRAGYIQNADGYKAINNYLRGLDTLPSGYGYQTTIDTMIRTTTENTLQHNYIGFRKVAPDYLQNVMGIDVTGRCLREGTPSAYFDSAKSAREIAKQISALAGTDKGILTDKSVTSVSLCENINYFTFRPIKFVIQMPAGTQGLITDNWPESEFMARPNTSLQILGAESCKYTDRFGEKDGIIIYARMVQA